MIRPNNGVKFIHQAAASVFELFKRYFHLMSGFVGDPGVYLGSKLRMIRKDNGV